MSIRTIDTQIMITRATDVMKETGSYLRQGETSQEQLAARQILDSAQDQSRVLSTTETEMEDIRDDIDGSGTGTAGGGGSPKEEEEEMTEDQKLELLVPPAEHDYLIDITV
ncbi:MAG: hypothetical protein LBC73_10230 [Oscillospiraceae bacterium]|nr:hypothetical protein [Oscillospiraceae bacterium]